MTVTPCSTTVSFGRVSWQLPPRSAARSTITEPGAMADHVGGDEHGRVFPRDEGRGDHHIALGHHARQQLALAPVKGLVLRARVAARVLRIGRLERQLHETAPEALYLLLCRGTEVVG